MTYQRDEESEGLKITLDAGQMPVSDQEQKRATDGRNGRYSGARGTWMPSNLVEPRMYASLTTAFCPQGSILSLHGSICLCAGTFSRAEVHTLRFASFMHVDSKLT